MSKPQKKKILWQSPGVKTATAIIILSLLPLLFFVRFFPFTTYIDPGESAQHFAMRLLVARFLKAGIIPLWNPFYSCGLPLIGDSLVAALYPFNILYFLLSPEIACNAFMLLHFSLAGLFTFFYIRALGVSRTGALLGAITYAFSGSVASHRLHVTLQNAIVWLPLILLCLVKNMRERSWGFVILGSIAVAFQVLAGHFQGVVLTAMIAFLLLLFPPLEPNKKTLLTKALPSFLMIFAIGFLLSAPFLLPAYELSRYSVRDRITYEFFVTYSFHPFLLLLLFFPNAFGNETATLFGPRYWGPWNLSEMGAAFCGIIPLSLAIIAVLALRRSNRAVKSHAILALIGLLLALGKYNPIYRLMYYVPVYNLFRCPCRNLLAYNLAIAVLSAFGLDALLGRWRSAPKEMVFRATGRVMVGLFLIILASCFFMAFFPSFIHAWSGSSKLFLVEEVTPRLRQILEGIILKNNAFLFPLFIIGATIILLYMLRSGYRRNLLIPLLFCIAWVDLMSFGSLHWTTPRNPRSYLHEDLYPPPVKTLISLGAQSNEFRVCPFLPMHHFKGGYRTRLIPPHNLFYEIPCCTRYGSSYLKKYKELTGMGPMGETPESWMENRPLLSMLNVRYLVCTQKAAPYLEGLRGHEGEPLYQKVWENPHRAIYENTACLPRAWLVSRVLPVSSFNEAKEILLNPVSGFDPATEALVEADKLPMALGPETGTANITLYSPNRLKIKCMSENPDLLVLSEIFYPGWRARIDGEDAPIFPTNGILRGIFIPPGEHEVDVYYSPTSFHIGIIGSVMGVMVLVLLALFACLRKMRTG